MNKPEQSKCAIKRTGVIVSTNSDIALLEIDGKRIAVPLAKCDHAVRLGAHVAWNGVRWVVMQDEAE